MGVRIGRVTARPNRSSLERIALGDGAALPEFLLEYGDLLWSLARGMTRSDTEAEEAVQDLLVHLWQKAPRFDPSVGEEVTFVSVVARRRLIDRARRVSREPRARELSNGSLPGDNGGGPGEEAAQARRIFDSLPSEQRTVLRLSIVHGCSHEAIAAQTGMPLGTVKTHIRRGLAEIRERMPDNDGGAA